MIRLSANKYYLERVPADFFWKELDKITAGQSLNPEFGYNRSYIGQSESIFVGRKVGNQFSIFLYRPLNRFFRTAVLCKGVVAEQGRGVMIKCSFEYPFWSLIMLPILALSVFVMHDPIPVINEFMAGAIGIILYCLVVAYNHSNIKREMGKQLELIEERASKRGSTV